MQGAGRRLAVFRGRLLAFNTDAWAKAGVVFRTGLESGAPNIGLFVTPGGLICYQRRAAINGQTEAQTIADANAPVWLRLVRRGSIAIAHYSFDGVNWEDGVSWDMGYATHVVGLAVTSHRPGTLCTATFDNVRVLPASTAPPPLAPSGLAVSDAGSTSVALQWTDNSSDETSFLVERRREGEAFNQVAQCTGIPLHPHHPCTRQKNFWCDVGTDAARDSAVAGEVNRLLLLLRQQI